MNQEKVPSKRIDAEEHFGPATCFQFFQGANFKTTIILLYAAFALTLWKYIPPILVPTDSATRARVYNVRHLLDNPTVADKALAGDSDAQSLSLFLSGEQKIFAAFLLLGLIPIGIVKCVFREKLSDYGLQFGNRFTLRSMLIFTPVMILVGYWSSFDPHFYLVYPFNPLVAGAGTTRFILHAVLYAACYYFAWEFMFRGFMLRGLTPTCGPFVAILIQTLAATMLHYGHPLSEVLGSIGGSIFWGGLYFRTRSIYSGFVQHATLGIALDYFIIHHLSP